MDMRQCDVCGALADTKAPQIGSASLNVLRRMPPANPLEQMFSGITSQPVESFDLCVECASQFVALIQARREQRL